MVPVTGTPEEMEAVGQAAQEADRRHHRAADRAVGGRGPARGPRPHRLWDRFDLAGASREELVAHLDETWARQRRIWDLHFVIVLPVYLAISEFDELYRGLFPDAGPLDSYRLLEGLPNMTVEVGQELWRLSRVALASPAVREALETASRATCRPRSRPPRRARAFLAKLGAYVDRYGRRADKWTMLAPSWTEDPTPVIERLQDFIGQPDSDAPGGEGRPPAAGRDAAIAEARERLADYPAPVVGQFEAMLEAAQIATVITEDHNFWIDNHGDPPPAAVLLECGRRLVADGALTSADEVFMLDPEELRDALAEPGIDLRTTAAERAALLERQASLEAPAVLGTLPTGPAAGRRVRPLHGEVLRRAAGGRRGRRRDHGQAGLRGHGPRHGAHHQLDRRGRPAAAGRHPRRRDDRAAVDAAVRDRRRRRDRHGRRAQPLRRRRARVRDPGRRRDRRRLEGHRRRPDHRGRR